MLKETLAKKLDFELINEISLGLIDIFRLKYTQHTKELNNPLLRWMDFRLRYIDPKPRKIIFSDKFPKKKSLKFNKFLDVISKKILLGEDINAYQGKGLILHHDTSGKKRRNRTDHLLAEWGIYHLHLSDDKLEDDSFVKSSKWLLFCLIDENFVIFVDVLPHNEDDIFENFELIKTINKNWPQFFDNYKLKGVSSANIQRSSKEIKELRRNGLATTFSIGEETYLLPGGITSASTSVKSSIKLNEVRKYIKELSNEICDPNGQFQKETIGPSIFSLKLSPRGLIVYEPNSKKGFLPPKIKKGVVPCSFAKLNEMIAPKWVVERLKNKFLL